MPTFTSSTVYSGAQVTTGTYAAGVVILPSTYDGTAALTTGTTLSLSGSISAVGSTVTLTMTALNSTPQTSTATYEGYYLNGTNTIYVFRDSAVTGGAFAISATGATVPVNTAAANLTTTGTIPTCFLRGTRIATAEGEVAVEALRVGDLVATLRDGERVLEPVTWIGHRSVTVLPGSSIEDFPVRIRVDAIRDGVPTRDLLVTSEHCLFLDGRLIPARMLVNDRSIVVATDLTQYEYFHVELERHGILIADGLEAESYLDTGNRGNFANAEVPGLRPDFSVDPAHKSWAEDAAAPLAVDRDTVEPIWKRLSSRATTLGMDGGVRAAPVVNEPDLRLLTDGGLEINPTLFDGKVYAFVVPGYVGSLRLLSRTSRPSDVVGPFLDDRRRLGVLVGRIGFSEERRRTVSNLHLTTPDLSGWHATESGAGCRWTSGDALLPLDLSQAAGRPVFLDIEVVKAGPYLAPARAA